MKEEIPDTELQAHIASMEKVKDLIASIRTQLIDKEAELRDTENYINGSAVYHAFIALVHGAYAIGLNEEEAKHLVTAIYAEENARYTEFDETKPEE